VKSGSDLCMKIVNIKESEWTDSPNRKVIMKGRHDHRYGPEPVVSNAVVSVSK